MDPSGSGYGHIGAQNRPLRRECLGSDAPWAREPSLLGAARLALALGGPENAGIVQKWSVPTLHREAERDTTGSNSRQHPRTYVDWAVGAREASRAGNSHPYSQNAHQDVVKKPLTLGFYWARKGASEAGDSVATRANRQVLLGCVLLCGAALGCAELSLVSAEEPARPSQAQPQSQATVPGFPVASDARLAGDAKLTRFVLDLDKTIQFRAFALDDPYRVVIDIPQVNFRLPPGTGTSGRGLVKAFRYGMVMPGGSRVVFDLTGPAKIANATMLDAANDQPPRLGVELEEVDRPTFLQ